MRRINRDYYIVKPISNLNNEEKCAPIIIVYVIGALLGNGSKPSLTHPIVHGSKLATTCPFRIAYPRLPVDTVIFEGSHLRLLRDAGRLVGQDTVAIRAHQLHILQAVSSLSHPRHPRTREEQVFFRGSHHARGGLLQQANPRRQTKCHH